MRKIRSIITIIEEVKHNRERVVLREKEYQRLPRVNPKSDEIFEIKNKDL